jgi:hypothetical protein
LCHSTTDIRIIFIAGCEPEAVQEESSVNPWRKHVLVPLLLVAAPCFSLAQQSGAQPPVKGMASTVGLYVYPQKKQSATQQLTDEQQCYNSAKTQTGYDPNATAPAPKTKDQKSGNDNHDVAKGAARGAIVSGATGGDAAAGAKRGAIIGGIRSKREKKKDDEAKQQTEAKKTAPDKKQDDFKRAISACLDARGYSVR